MTDPAPFRVAVMGGVYLNTAMQLHGRGIDVVLVETNTDDRNRLRDICSRSARDLEIVPKAPAVDLSLGNCESSAWPVLSFDWKAANRPGISVHWGATSPWVEAWGDLQNVDLSGLAKALKARVSNVQPGQPPTGLQIISRVSIALERHVLSGASPWDIDNWLESQGFVTGPFSAQDQLGLDALLALRTDIPKLQSPPLLQRAVSEGRLGRAHGVGWFRYPGGGGRVEDPLIEDMAAEEARFAGIVQQEASEDFPGEKLRQDIAECISGISRDACQPREEVADLAAHVLTCPRSFPG